MGNGSRPRGYIVQSIQMGLYWLSVCRFLSFHGSPSSGPVNPQVLYRSYTGLIDQLLLLLPLLRFLHLCCSGRFSGHGWPPWSFSPNFSPGISFCYWTAAGYKLRRINTTFRSFLCLFTAHCEFLPLQTWCPTWGVHKQGRPLCHPSGAQIFEVAPRYVENFLYLLMENVVTQNQNKCYKFSGFHDGCSAKDGNLLGVFTSCSAFGFFLRKWINK